MDESTEINSFLRSVCAVIPFDDVKGEEFDLLMAASVEPGIPARIIQMTAGFSALYFSELEEGSACEKEYYELMKGVGTFEYQDFQGYYGKEEKNSAVAGGRLLHVGVQAKAEKSSSTQAYYSVTGIKKRSLQGSRLFLPFLEKHLPAFAAAVPELKITFDAQTTFFSGSIDKVVAIVIAAVTGKRQFVLDAGKEAAGEVKMSAKGSAVSCDITRQSFLSQRNKPREGMLGASFCIFHLSKSHRSNRVKVKDRAIVKSEDDAHFVHFLRRAKLKAFRHLLFGLPKSPMGYLTEWESDMESYATLNEHVEGMEVDEPFKSLGWGGWEEGKGVVNLKVTSSTTKLYDEARLPEGNYLSQHFKGSMNFILTSNSLEYLSNLYQSIKRDKTVQVAGMTVWAMSPVFTVDTSSFLPIYFLGEVDELDGLEVPGAVVRDYEGAAFVFPVHGYEQNKSSATVYDDQWEVRESIVHLSRDDVKNVKLLKERGFHEIRADEGTEKADEVVLGRHQLARIGDALDDGESIFRVGPADATTTAAAMASSMPSLGSSSGDHQHTKKHKTTHASKKT